MKKTYITNNETSERYALYVGINQLYGDWMMETSGDPDTLNTLEDNGCTALIEKITSTINDPATEWEQATEEDSEYVAEWLKIWGLAE